MKSFNLIGVNAEYVPVKLGKDVAVFIDDKAQFTISIIDASSIELVTAKGKYTLAKHPTLSYFSGTLNGHKVQVHLKAIFGWIRYW